MEAQKKVLLDIHDLKVHFSIAQKSAWPWTKAIELESG